MVLPLVSDRSTSVVPNLDLLWVTMWLVWNQRFPIHSSLPKHTFSGVWDLWWLECVLVPFSWPLLCNSVPLRYRLDFRLLRFSSLPVPARNRNTALSCLHFFIADSELRGFLDTLLACRLDNSIQWFTEFRIALYLLLTNAFWLQLRNYQIETMNGRCEAKVRRAEL